MRKLTGLLFLVALSLMIGSVVFANLNDFTSTWVNADSNSNGITRLSIQANGDNVTMQVWGKCHPTDCDWGIVPAKSYGTTISSVLPSTATALSAEFTYSTIRNFVLVKRVGNQLQVENLTTYTDGRSSQYASYIFNRQLSIPIGPIRTIVPIVPATPVQTSPANGSVFGHFPRTTTLKWNAVAGAASYTVEVDCFHCCQSGKWCTDVGQEWKVVTGLTTTSYTFDFVGAQPGRWRVWAIGAGGQQSAKSGWWGFSYTK